MNSLKMHIKNKNIGNFLLVVTAFVCLLSACGEDRTYEYHELTTRDREMQVTLTDWYLWGDSLTDVDWKNYFLDPDAFLAKMQAMTPDGDDWSYCSIDTLDEDYFPIGNFQHNDSYGIDVKLVTDPTGETTKQFARVVTVFDNSPASRCGIQRNDFIGTVDDVKMSSSVLSKLVSGRSHSLLVSHIGYDEEEGTLVWTSVDTVTLEMSQKVDVPAVTISKMLNSDVAYIMLTNMNSIDAIAPSISNLLSNDPQDLIIDVRLCNQGTIDCAVGIANLVASMSGTFLQTVWNSRHSSENHTYEVNATSGVNLFFLTSGYTQGAAEWLIYGLKSANRRGVVTVGQTTAGQNVMLKDFATQFYYTLHAATCYVNDRDGNHDYAYGISPDLEVDEFESAFIYPYGDEREALIDAVLSNY